MRLGLVINNNGAPAAEAVPRMAREAEALGYDSLWVTDHVIGVKSFKPVYGATWMEPLTSLAWIAGATQKIRLGIGVLVAKDPIGPCQVAGPKAILPFASFSGQRIERLLVLPPAHVPDDPPAVAV